MADPRDDRLAAELRELADWLDTPPPPDLRAAVRQQLRDPVPRAATGWPWRWPALGWRWRGPTRGAWPGPTRGAWPGPTRGAWPGPTRRRWLAAAMVIVLAVALAVVPQGRAAVAAAVTGLLRFAGIEFRDGPPRPLPATPGPLPSTRSVTLDQARLAARFPVGVPAALGPPERVLLIDPAADGAPRVVSLFYRNGTVRVDQFDGTVDVEIAFGKQVGIPGKVAVSVGGERGIWVPTPHPLFYVDRNGVYHQEGARLAAATLIWMRAGVTYRLEGPFSADEAVAIATSVR